MADESFGKGNFNRLGAITYIALLDEKYRKGETLDEWEINRFYEARKSMLEHDKFLGSFEDRKKAHKKYEGALKEFRATDPSRDIPF